MLISCLYNFDDYSILLSILDFSLGDLEWDVSEVETEATDVTMDDNMLMLGEGSSTWADSQEPSRDLIVFSPNPSSESESPATESAPEGGPVLALPPSTSVPMEVDRIMTMALPNSYMPYQGKFKNLFSE